MNQALASTWVVCDNTGIGGFIALYLMPKQGSLRCSCAFRLTGLWTDLNNHEMIKVMSTCNRAFPLENTTQGSISRPAKRP